MKRDTGAFLSETQLAEAKSLAFHSSWKRTALDLFLLALSGMYFTLAFPGVNFSIAAWTGIIPLVALCANRSPFRAFFYGLTWGYFWSLTGCFFLREIMFLIPFVFGFVLGAFSALFAAAIPFVFKYILYPEEIRKDGFRKTEPFYNFSPFAEILCCLALTGWWILLEWLRSWIFTGFPWNLVAATQWNNNNFIQICEFTGIYGVSFLVVLINISAYFAIRGLRYSLPQGRYKRPWAFLLAAVLCLANSWFGAQTVHWRKAEYAHGNLRYFAVGVVQPHLSQRRDGSGDLSREALEVCTVLSCKLIADDKFLKSGAAAEIAAMTGTAPDTVHPDSPDMLRDVLPLELIVWPESAVPVPYYSGHEIATEYRQTVRKLMRDGNVPFLVGSITADEIEAPDKYNLYNSALLLRHKQKAVGNEFYDLDSIYSKVHLVPFGEFIPLNDSFPKIGALVGMGRNLSNGKGFFPLYPAKDIRAGVLICYEDVFPYAAREQARAGANMLLVITNDAWYPTSTEPEQHYANSVFRAVETRLPMLRCGNSNYSVLIDPRGRTTDAIFRTEKPGGEVQLHPGRQAQGSMKFIVPVPKKHTPTFYTRYGNVFVLLCGVFAFAGLLVVLYRKYTFRFHFASKFEAEREKLRADFLNKK